MGRNQQFPDLFFNLFCSSVEKSIFGRVLATSDPETCSGPDPDPPPPPADSFLSLAAASCSARLLGLLPGDDLPGIGGGGGGGGAPTIGGGGIDPDGGGGGGGAAVEGGGGGGGAPKDGANIGEGGHAWGGGGGCRMATVVVVGAGVGIFASRVRSSRRSSFCCPRRVNMSATCFCSASIFSFSSCLSRWPDCRMASSIVMTLAFVE